MKACKVMSKGCLDHIVRVQDLDSKIPLIESIPIVREFLEVFPNNITGISGKLILVSTFYQIQIKLLTFLSDGLGRIKRVEGSSQGFARKKSSLDLVFLSRVLRSYL